jgi:hypothetical protein
LLPLPADKVVENKLFVFTIVIGDEPPVEPVEIVIYTCFITTKVIIVLKNMI